VTLRKIIVALFGATIVALAVVLSASANSRNLSDGSCGYSNQVYGWKATGDWGQLDPYGGAIYMYSSHNLCTNDYSSCNAAGYVATSAPP
jgi:hypothetical protein